MADPEEAGEEYADVLGVITALERTCELESRLRQCIQDTHPLTTTLDWDFEAADREREGLLAISEQLEFLEDKLREYRFLDPADVENKAVLLGQLDSVRRELVEVCERWAPAVLFGKEVVREVYAFAQVAEGEEGEGPEHSDDASPDGSPQTGAGAGGEPTDVELLAAARRMRQQGSGGSQGGFASEIEPEAAEEGPARSGGSGSALHRGGSAEYYAAEAGAEELRGEPAQLIPAVRRSGSGVHPRPPRYPTGRELGGGGKQLAGTVPPASPKRASSNGGGSATTSPPPSLHQQHLAYQQSPPARAGFLTHQQRERERPLGAHAVPGSTRSPGAAATVSALRSSVASLARQQAAGGRRQLDVDAAARGLAPRSGAETYSFNAAAAAAAAAPASYPPSAPASTYAPSEGIPSSRQSPHSARGAPLGGRGGVVAAAAAPPPPPQRPANSLLTKLNRAQGGGGHAYADSASRYDTYSRVRDEDIYGALDDGPGGRPSSLRPASIMNPSPRQYGGYVRIRDRLGAGSEGTPAKQTPLKQEQRREPMPPRIYGDDSAVDEIQPAGYAASVALDPPARERRSAGIISEDPPARQPSPLKERLALAYSSGGAGSTAGRSALAEVRSRRAERERAAATTADSGARRRGGLVRRVAGLALTGAAAAAAVVLAQRAAPVVAQKGHDAARRLHAEQRKLAARWQRHREQRRAAREQQQRQRALRAAADRPPQGFRGLVDVPPPQLAGGGRGGRMADLPPQARPQGGRGADLPPWEQPQAAKAAKQQWQQQQQRQQPMPQPQPQPQPRPQQAQQQGRGAKVSDPLPPHLAGAGARAPQGGWGRIPPVAQVPPPPHGQLFPAMPPPDVSASMG